MSICIAAGTLDITPAATTWLSGYAGHQRPSQDVAEPLTATAIAFQAEDGQRAFIMSVDALYAGRALTQRLREELYRNHDISAENILVAASHTHFAPALDNTKPCLGAFEPDTAAEIIEKCLELANMVASAKARPVRVERGSSEWKGTVHRRRHWPLPRLGAGKRLLPPGPVMAPAPDHPADRELNLILIRDQEGTPLAAIISCACHPVGQPRRNSISSDFCHYLRGEVRRLAGKDLPVLFLQGFAGDQRPLPPTRPSLRDRMMALLIGPGFAQFDESGWAAWTDALRYSLRSAWDRLEPAAGVDTGIEAKQVKVPLNRLIHGEGTAERDIEFQRIRIGGMLDLIGVEAECSAGLRALIPFPLTIAVGYIGDPFGYWAQETQIQAGGYEGKDHLRYFGLDGVFRPDSDELFRQSVAQLALSSREAQASIPLRPASPPHSS